MNKLKLGILVGSVSAVAASGITAGGFAIAQAVQNKNNYKQSLKDCKNDAYGRIAKEVSSAIARTPDMYEQIKAYVNLCMEALESDWVTPMKAFSIGVLVAGDDINELRTGGGAIELIADAYKDKYNWLFQETQRLLKLIKDENDYTAFAIAVAGSSTFYVSVRYESQQTQIRSLLDLITTNKQSINDANKYAFGRIIGVGAEGVARSSTFYENINNLLALTINWLSKTNINVNQANALTNATTNSTDAVVRQADTFNQVYLVLAFSIYEIMHNSTAVADCYYNFIGSVPSSIARLPESASQIVKTFTIEIAPLVRKVSASNQEAVAKICVTLFESLAREPEWSNVLLAEAKTMINLILNN